MTAPFQPLTVPYALPPAAPISDAQCRALLGALGLELAAVFDSRGGAFRNRDHTVDVTPLPLAVLARLFDFEASLIAIVEEAQFLGQPVTLRANCLGELALDLEARPPRSANRQPFWSGD